MLDLRACVRLTLLAILPVTVLLAGSAQAAIVTMTYDGVIRTGFGRTSLFGRPAAELVGFDYRAVYRFDTEIGRHMQDATFESVSGGSRIDTPSPLLGATLMINGVTLQLLGERLALGSTVRDRTGSRVASWAVQNPDPEGFVVRSELEHRIFSRRSDSGVRPALDEAFVFDIEPTDTVDRAYFEYRETVDERTFCCTTVFNFTPQRLTEAVAVPEPTTWAAMVTGFGILGAALRRRRQGIPAMAA